MNTEMYRRKINDLVRGFPLSVQDRDKVTRHMLDYADEVEKYHGYDADKVWEQCEEEFKNHLGFLCNAKVGETYQPKSKKRVIKVAKYDLDDLDALISRCLKSRRLDTNERIGIFVTNLRRDMACHFQDLPAVYGENGNEYAGDPLTSFLSKFFNKDFWQEICVPKLNGKWGFNNRWKYECLFGGKRWEMSYIKMEELCEEARRLVGADQDNNSALVSLERDLYPLKSNIDKMLKLNEEADRIMANLCAAAEGK
jgi:hypothetical protein